MACDHLSGNAKGDNAAAWDGHILAALKGLFRHPWVWLGGWMAQNGVSRGLMSTREVTVSPLRVRQEENRHREGYRIRGVHA